MKVGYAGIEAETADGQKLRVELETGDVNVASAKELDRRRVHRLHVVLRMAPVEIERRDVDTGPAVQELGFHSQLERVDRARRDRLESLRLNADGGPLVAGRVAEIT